MSRLSHRPSQPAYYIVDCRFFVLEPYPICFELRSISVILLQCDVKHWSFVSPAAKFHLTGLVVKWEPSNINLESERKWYEGASI